MGMIFGALPSIRYCPQVLYPYSYTAYLDNSRAIRMFLQLRTILHIRRQIGHLTSLQIFPPFSNMRECTTRRVHPLAQGQVITWRNGRRYKRRAEDLVSGLECKGEILKCSRSLTEPGRTYSREPGTFACVHEMQWKIYLVRGWSIKKDVEEKYNWELMNFSSKQKTDWLQQAIVFHMRLLCIHCSRHFFMHVGLLAKALQLQELMW